MDLMHYKTDIGTEWPNTASHRQVAQLGEADAAIFRSPLHIALDSRHRHNIKGIWRLESAE